MTTTASLDPHPPDDPPSASLIRSAIWVGIGALIAAAIVCAVWVLVGPDNDIIARAFLTVVLLAGFAGVMLVDAHFASRRPAWFTLASMVAWVATLLIGAVMIWLPERDMWSGVSRSMTFTVIAPIPQLALLHVYLFTNAYRRNRTTFTRIIYAVTVALVPPLAVMVVVPLMLSEYLDPGDLYWRIVVAMAILAAVGTALLPLTSALFAPERPRLHPGLGWQPWPTYVDGVTPLPMLPDGSPDWQAYYSGYPSPGAQSFSAPAPAPDPATAVPVTGSPHDPASPREQPAPAAPAARSAYGTATCAPPARATGAPPAPEGRERSTPPERPIP